MAKKAKSPKPVEVSSFGGTQKLTDTTIGRDPYEVSSMEAQSETKLEHDEGHGAALVLRCFTFKANPEVFQHHQPTKQELFNHHLKGIEIALWRDGLTPFVDSEPRLIVNKEKGTYEIWVGARPMKGHMLHEKPQTLTEIAHG